MEMTVSLYYSTMAGGWRDGLLAGELYGDKLGGNLEQAYQNFGVIAPVATNFTLGCWWARRDLNPQPRDYESPALTVELQALQ
jgi:hypothetical protein